MSRTRSEEMKTPPMLDGELSFDEGTRNEHADDFGHILHTVPEGVVMPVSADDIAKTIEWTAQQGGKFAAQGQDRKSVV